MPVADEGQDFGTRSGLPCTAQTMQGLIGDIQGAGTCVAEAAANRGALAFTPVEVDLSQD